MFKKGGKLQLKSEIYHIIIDLVSKISNVKITTNAVIFICVLYGGADVVL